MWKGLRRALDSPEETGLWLFTQRAHPEERWTVETLENQHLEQRICQSRVLLEHEPDHSVTCHRDPEIAFEEATFCAAGGDHEVWLSETSRTCCTSPSYATDIQVVAARTNIYLKM